MEECLGVNVRPVAREDCSLEEWEHGAVLYDVKRVMADHVISAMN